MCVWICALKCRASNSPGDGVTGSFELSNMGADIELRSSARTVCILDYWTELSPAPGLNLFHLRFVLSSQIPAHVLMKSSGNFSFLFIDFKLPIFRETLWFIIKLFVVSVVCGAHCLLALFLLCPLWYSGMSRLILVLIFFSRFSSTPVSVQKCTAVSCVCLSALHLYYLRQVCLQSWLCQWIPSSAPEARGQSLCTTVPRSPLGAGLWSQGLVIV